MVLEVYALAPASSRSLPNQGKVPLGRPSPVDGPYGTGFYFTTSRSYAAGPEGTSSAQRTFSPWERQQVAIALLDPDLNPAITGAEREQLDELLQPWVEGETSFGEMVRRLQDRFPAITVVTDIEWLRDVVGIRKPETTRELAGEPPKYYIDTGKPLVLDERVTPEVAESLRRALQESRYICAPGLDDELTRWGEEGVMLVEDVLWELRQNVKVRDSSVGATVPFSHFYLPGLLRRAGYDSISYSLGADASADKPQQVWMVLRPSQVVAKEDIGKAATVAVRQYLRRSRKTSAYKPVRSHVRRGRPAKKSKKSKEKAPRRRQYTEEQLDARQQKKFESCLRIQQNISQIDEWIDTALGYEEPCRASATAVAVYLMRHLAFRIGTLRMAAAHETFGAVSLRVEHVTVRGDEIMFRFPGKLKIPWERAVVSPQLARKVKQFMEGREPGEQLLWYEDSRGNRYNLSEYDVARRLRRWDIRPKDFRTWCANLLMYDYLQSHPVRKGQNPEDVVNAAFDHVAQFMGHTPDVAKRDYVFKPLWQHYLDNGGRIKTSGAFETGWKPIAKSLRWPDLREAEAGFSAWLREYASSLRKAVSGGKKTCPGAKRKTRLRFRNGVLLDDFLRRFRLEKGDLAPADGPDEGKLHKAVIRTPMADGHVDWDAVPVGDSIWVTITKEGPLRGRRLLLTKRPDGLFTVTGGTPFLRAGSFDPDKPYDSGAAYRHMVMSPESGAGALTPGERKVREERRRIQEELKPLREEARKKRKELGNRVREARRAYQEAIGFHVGVLTSADLKAINKAFHRYALEQGCREELAQRWANAVTSSLRHAHNYAIAHYEAEVGALAQHIEALVEGGMSFNEARRVACAELPVTGPIDLSRLVLPSLPAEDATDVEIESTVRNQVEESLQQLMQQAHEAPPPVLVSEEELEGEAATSEEGTTVVQGPAETKPPTTGELLAEANKQAAEEDLDVAAVIEHNLEAGAIGDVLDRAIAEEVATEPEPPTERPAAERTERRATAEALEKLSTLERLEEPEEAKEEKPKEKRQAAFRRPEQIIRDLRHLQEVTEQYRNFHEVSLQVAKLRRRISQLVAKMPKSVDKPAAVLARFSIEAEPVSEQELQRRIEEYHAAPPSRRADALYQAAKKHWGAPMTDREGNLVRDEEGNPVAGPNMMTRQIIEGASSALTGIVGKLFRRRVDVGRLVSALTPEGAAAALAWDLYHRVDREAFQRIIARLEEYNAENQVRTEEAILIRNQKLIAEERKIREREGVLNPLVYDQLLAQNLQRQRDNLGVGLGSLQASAALLAAMRMIEEGQQPEVTILCGDSREYAEERLRELKLREGQKGTRVLFNPRSGNWEIRASVFGLQRFINYQSYEAQRNERWEAIKNDESEVTEADTPPGFKSTIVSLNPETGKREETPLRLRKAQRNDIRWLLEAGGGMVTRVTGAGKTLTAVGFIAHKLAENPNHRGLVIVPRGHVERWAEEVQRFTDLPVYVIPETGADKAKRARLYNRGPGIYITAHRQASFDTDAIEAAKFDTCVVDEPQMLRSSRSHRLGAQARRIFRMPFQHRIALTATPAREFAVEAYNLVNWTNPGALGPRTQFERAFTGFGAGTNAQSEALGTLLNDVLAPYISSSKQESRPYQVTHRNHELSISEAQRRREAEIDARLPELIKQYRGKGGRTAALKALMEMHRGNVDDGDWRENPKAQQMLRQIAEIDREDPAGKHVIYVSSPEQRQMVTAALLESGFRRSQVKNICQGTDASDVHKRKAQWQNDPNCRFIIIDSSSCTGHNLQEGSYLHVLGAPKDAAEQLQTYGRICRSPRHGDVQIFGYRTDSPFESEDWHRLDEQIKLIQATAPSLLEESGIELSGIMSKSLYSKQSEARDWFLRRYRTLLRVAPPTNVRAR